jgi:hypothetical protein
MRTIQRLTVVLELVILFGPATILLFMAPIGLIGAAHAGAIFLVMTAAAVLLGGFSLYVCMHLAAHALDENHPVPSLWVVALAWVSGAGAFLSAGIYVRFEPLILLIITLPILGGAHLTWLSWESIARARKA